MRPAQAKPDVGATRTATIDRAPDITHLLRQLVDRLPEPEAVNGRDDKGASQEVLLQVHLEGRLYTLTRSTPQPTPAPVSLSPREREIVRLIASGLPNKAIAAVLDISLWTVATYVRRLFAKLKVSSRAELVARVFAEDLLHGGE
jgi:DNA-binding CsgD family transcriptional regulator